MLRPLPRLAVWAGLLALWACGGGSSAPSNSCTDFTSPGPGAPSFTLTGTVRYEDRPFGVWGLTGTITPLPVRLAKVQVVRCADSAVLATGTTATDGTYSISAANNGPAGVYVRALAEVSETVFSVRVRDTKGHTHAVRSIPFDENSATSRDLTAGVSAGGGAFNILDTATTGIEYMAAHLPGGLPTLPPLTVVWEYGVTDGTYYRPSIDTLYLISQPNATPFSNPDTDEYDDPVIQHEVGHFLADQIARDDSPGGAHSIVESDQDARLAWSEGWGNFFAVLPHPTEPGRYVDTTGRVDEIYVSFDLEAVDVIPSRVPPGGSTSELAVAATLWDAADTPSGPPDDDPATTVGIGPVLDAFAEMDQTDVGAPTVFGRWWSALRRYAGLTPAELNDVSDTAALQGIDWAADAGGDDPAGNDSWTGALALPTPAPASPSFASANLAYLPESATTDLDFFSVTLNGGTSYHIDTVSLGDGADTYLTVYDTDGTTPLLTNDNWHGTLFAANCGTWLAPPCPPNDATTLASDISFTPATGGDYFIRVSRSPNAPPSAGLFGRYTLKVSTP